MSATAFQRARREIAAKEAAESVEAVTRDDIAAMKKADVIDLLEAHGVEGADGKIGELRKMLVQVMFVEDQQ